MESSVCRSTFCRALDGLVEEALAAGVGPEIAARARQATLLRMGDYGNGSRSSVLARRSRAYFWAVVRRQAVKRGQPASGAARFIVAAVVQDLRSAGRDEQAIWVELERGWSKTIPSDVLEEYRLRLCG